MCRSIRTLFNFEPPATDEEIRASSLQFVRKLSGFTGRRRRTRRRSSAPSTRSRRRARAGRRARDARAAAQPRRRGDEGAPAQRGPLHRAREPYLTSGAARQPRPTIDLARISLAVRDYDEAVAFFTDASGSCRRGRSARRRRALGARRAAGWRHVPRPAREGRDAGAARASATRPADGCCCS